MKFEMSSGILRLKRLIGLGKNFCREELNRMIDELAANAESENDLRLLKRRRPELLTDGPSAMCYTGAPCFSVQEVKFVCQQCGRTLRYELLPDFRMLFMLEGLRCDVSDVFRATVDWLGSRGLNIEIDESSLCPYCVSLKTLRIPTSATIVSGPSFRHERIKDSVKRGDRVFLVDCDDWFSYCEVTPCHGPKTSVFVDRDCLGDFGYDEENREHPRRSRLNHVSWVFEGKKTPIRMQDAHLLQSLVKGGREHWTDRNIRRLREILGGAADGLATAARSGS